MENLREINPFVVNKGTLEYKRIKTQEISTSSFNSAYQPEGSITSRHILVDAHRKTNLYCPSVKLMDDLIFKNLSVRSRDLLLYIMIHLTENQDFIKLPYKIIISRLKMSRNTVTKSIKELKLAGLIADKGQSVYWINPMYLFRGNRLKYYMDINPNIIREV